MATLREVEISFETGLALSEAAELALEDYARVLAEAARASARRSSLESALVRGVTLHDPGRDMTPALQKDIEDFARALTLGQGGPGLGWS